MTTAVLATPPFLAFYDADGEPLSGGLVYTYAAGTTTPKATFTDVTATVEMPNPIVLDSAGRATWWINGAYKYVVKDSLGNTIKTTDNVTSFNTLADSVNAFFQSFSGDGTTTSFTLSENLGTEEKGLMVFVDNGLQESVANGNFATDTIWTKGSGWTIAAGVATATGAISTAISQTSLITLVAGQAYAVTYTITRSAGGLIPSIGGQNGTERTASGTYREVIVAGSSQIIAFTGNGFTGTLDSVSVSVADTAGFNILAPTAFTVNGTALTLAAAPAVGTNNIYVFAPSTLLGAASAAASLAQSYAADALTSANEAAASASLAAVSIKWRPVVACASTGNLTLSGEQTIDGVLTSASRVLVKDQIAQAENGVYVSSAGAWTRATDADTWNELVGQAVTVNAGTVNALKSFANTNETGGTLGTTAVTWTEVLFYPGANTVSTATIQASAVTGAKLNDSFISDLTTVTAASDDYVAIADISDSNKKKKSLISDILTLALANRKVSNFTFDMTTATGTVAITGVGFQPRMVFLLGAVSATPACSMGFSDGTGQFCIAQNDGGTADNWSPSTTATARITTSTGNFQVFTINSFDSDGFTIGNTKTSSPTGTVTFGYIAIR